MTLLQLRLHPRQQPFTTLSLALLAVFVLDLFTGVLRQFESTLLTAEPAFGVIVGMLAVIREEERRFAWVALALNAFYLVIVLAGIALQGIPA